MPISASLIPPRHGDFDFEQVEMTPTGGAQGVNAVANHQALTALENKLEQLFSPHARPANRDALAELVKSRAAALHEMGQTPDDVDQMIDKATRLDDLTLPVQGALGSTPFAVATVLLDEVPGITAQTTDNRAYTGFVAGSMSGAVDTFGNGLLTRTTEDSFWLKAPADKLEPVMQDAQAARTKETLKEAAIHSATAIQTFTARNVLRTVVSAAVTATKGPEAAATADTVVGSLGGMAAGAGYAVLMRKSDLTAHRAGAEYLFGRTDWQTQYKALQDSNFSTDPVVNGLKRAIKLPLDIATDTLKSVAGLATATSLTANGGALGGGFALSTHVRGAVTDMASREGWSPAAIGAVSHAVNVGLSALTFAAYGAAPVLTGPASESGTKFVQESIPAGAKVAGGKIAQGGRALGDFANQSLQGLAAMNGPTNAVTSGVERRAAAEANPAGQARRRGNAAPDEEAQV